MLKGIVAAVVVTAAVAVAPSASAGPVGVAPSGTVCDGRWHIRPSALAPPKRPGQEDLDVLDAVTAVSPVDQWAVGSWEQYPKAYAFHTLAEHSTGSRWRHVHSPDPGPPADSSLYGIAAITARDVWAVGGPTVIQPYHGLVEHWDGTSWSIARGASFPGVLYGVAAAGPRDIWAVGTLNFPGPGPDRALEWPLLDRGPAALQRVAAQRDRAGAQRRVGGWLALGGQRRRVAADDALRRPHLGPGAQP
jgi:hypothetical protein